MAFGDFWAPSGPCCSAQRYQPFAAAFALKGFTEKTTRLTAPIEVDFQTLNIILLMIGAVSPTW
jgi:hypothetical protein